MGCSPHKFKKNEAGSSSVLETSLEKSDYENEDDDEDEIRQIKPMESNHCGKCAPREQQSRPGLRQTRPKSMKPRWTSVWMSLTRT